jgi:hypothetical protein
MLSVGRTMLFSFHICDGRANQDSNIVVSISYYDSGRRDGIIQDQLCYSR